MAKNLGPGLPKTPQELLETPHTRPSLFEKYGMQVSGASILGSASMYGTYAAKRPVLSGVHRHVLFALLGGVAAHYVLEFRKKQWAERDAVLRHYISLHPEDFPPYERVKFGDVFEKWYPAR